MLPVHRQQSSINSSNSGSPSETWKFCVAFGSRCASWEVGWSACALWWLWYLVSCCGGWLYVNEPRSSDWGGLVMGGLTYAGRKFECASERGLTVAFFSSADSCESHWLATALPPYDEGALQPGADFSFSPSSAEAAGPPCWTCGWMLPGSVWAGLGLHVQRVFWLCVSVWRLLVDRWGVPEAGHGNDGGVGLVFGPAGDHPDLPLCQRYGLHQGRREAASLFIALDFSFHLTPDRLNSKQSSTHWTLQSFPEQFPDIVPGAREGASAGMTSAVSGALLVWEHCCGLFITNCVLRAPAFSSKHVGEADAATWVCLSHNEYCLLCRPNVT